MLEALASHDTKDSTSVSRDDTDFTAALTEDVKGMRIAEEPPGTCSGFLGFFVGPYAEVSVVEPMANSSILVLPTMTAPASFSFLTTVASYGGT